jgi:hypothetical protein
MSRDNVRAIHKMLCGLPLDDRLAALIVSLIERKPDAVDSVLSLIAVIGVMTRGLGVIKSFALAEALRDCADVIERRRELQRIDVD